MQTFTDSIPLAKKKLLERLLEDQILQAHPQRGKEESGLVQTEHEWYIHKFNLSTYKTSNC